MHTPKAPAPADDITLGEFVLNLRRRTLLKNGKDIELTQVEFQMIEYFFNNPDTALDRTDILEKVWGSNYFGEEKIVDVNIRRLRMKVSVSKTKKNQDVFKSRYLKIVYEDRYLIVIEKNVGILSMAAGHSTLNVKSVLDDYFHKTRQNCQAHVVHRLDRDTSGLMIYAKDKQTELALEDDWHHNVYDRRYVALVSGEMEEDEGTVANWLKDNKAYITFASDTDNGGKYAVTHFHTLQRTTAHSLVEYKLETGRKNQIRVHTADMGHPVCGDIKYGNGDDPCGRLCLHAYVLCFYHPVTHQPMEFETPIPNEFVRAMKEDNRPFNERGRNPKEANRKPFRMEGRNG